MKIKFKETEIGMIPEDWEIKIIDKIKSKTKNALAMGPFGSNIKKEFFVENGVPIIRGNNLNSYRFLDQDFVYLTEEKADELKSSNCYPGDVIVTHRGTLGQVGLIPKKSQYKRYVISQSGMKLTCDESQITGEYVFYFLKSPIGQRMLLRNTSQTGVPAIAQPLTSLKNIPLPVPDFDEQNRITKIFENLNDKIELNQTMNKTLETIGQAIFKHWFVDFEFPNEQGKPYKSSGGEMIYNKELGKEIPDGWKVKELSEFIDLDKGVSYKGAFLTEEGKGLPMANLGTFRPLQGFKDDGIKHYSGEYKEKHCIKPGDLIIANTDITQDRVILGSPAIIPSNLGSEEILFTHHIFAVRHKEDTLKNEYLYFLLQTPEYRMRVGGFATGTTVLALPKDAILELSIVISDRILLEKFNILIKRIMKKIETNQVEIHTLSKIRDSLLPKLMSGKIRVPIKAS